MRQFRRGSEWWELRDDGTWIKWNRTTLEWDPQDQAPPDEGLEEIAPKASATIDAVDSPDEGEPDPTVFVRPWRLRLTDPSFVRRSQNLEAFLFLLLILIAVGALYLLLRIIDFAFHIG
jgi:hypothetical protein